MEQSKQSKASIRPQPKVEDTGQAGPSKPTRKTSPTPVPQTMSEGKVTPGDYAADINSQIDGSGMTGYTPGGSMGFDSLFNMDTVSGVFFWFRVRAYFSSAFFLLAVRRSGMRPHTMRGSDEDVMRWS